jgi:ABC-type dipeptide/oligopeptide/nickel transport system permease subunit
MAPLLTPFGPRDVTCAPFEKPSLAHLFGCDDAGHDIFAQVIYGARVSITIGLLVALWSRRPSPPASRSSSASMAALSTAW